MLQMTEKELKEKVCNMPTSYLKYVVVKEVNDTLFYYGSWRDYEDLHFRKTYDALLLKMKAQVIKVV